MQLEDIKHGKGLWKFNNSLLNDIDYLNCINAKIEEIKQQYCLPVYCLDNLLDVKNDDIQFTINDQLFLETLLMEIRGKTISYSSYKAKCRNTKENDLIKEIELMENNFCTENKERLDTLHNELNALRAEKVKGHIIRSRAQYIDMGEKPTNFFCQLEKMNSSSKSIPFIEKDDGSLIFNQSEILNETSCFYEKLYSKNTEEREYDIDNDLKDFNVPKLSDEQALSLEGQINYDQATSTLKI